MQKMDVFFLAEKNWMVDEVFAALAVPGWAHGADDRIVESWIVGF